ncbi:glycosyltransferase family A protein [Flagellimonas sp. DF-77]|uniref:glycosyltransferase family A protein n=1 Tax=Flagellimonas algarum TaxID=3230298 RepID=UPI00339219AC
MDKLKIRPYILRLYKEPNKQNLIMLCFIVPVKSKVVSNDWNQFEKLVERTMKSLTNQIDDNYQIIVVCHEIPQMDFKHDKIEFVQVDFDPPKLDPNGTRDENREKKELDKSYKIKHGVKIAEKYHPDFLMVVDSDDLISNKILSYVNKQDQSSPGWYVNKGYNYKEGAKYLFYKNKTFNHLCGSSIIIRKDLIDELFVTEPWLWYMHETMETSAGNLQPLPFPAGVYSIANGENHFMSNNYTGTIIQRFLFDFSKYRQLFKKLAKYRIHPLNGKFKRTFNFYHIN